MARCPVICIVWLTYLSYGTVYATVSVFNTLP